VQQLLVTTLSSHPRLHHEPINGRPALRGDGKTQQRRVTCRTAATVTDHVPAQHLRDPKPFATCHSASRPLCRINATKISRFTRNSPARGNNDELFTQLRNPFRITSQKFAYTCVSRYFLRILSPLRDTSAISQPQNVLVPF
jgi:hypothetical protein